MFPRKQKAAHLVIQVQFKRPKRPPRSPFALTRRLSAPLQKPVLIFVTLREKFGGVRMSITIVANNRYISAETFRTKASRCLDLLMADANQYYTWMMRYDLSIRPAARSGANFQDGAIDIAQTTFDASDTWLASVFVHETVHFWQYRAGHYQAGTVAEREANVYQLAVLRCLRAPQGEITHMLSQDGGHADLNGDGVYDWRDYQIRNY
jgi:hypothetical protein